MILRLLMSRITVEKKNKSNFVINTVLTDGLALLSLGGSTYVGTGMTKVMSHMQMVMASLVTT